MDAEINCFFEDVNEIEMNFKATERWLFTCMEHYNVKSGTINYIFCSDDYLLDMNKTHLNHDYYTDIITFNYNNGELISGDLFISVDRIRDNAKKISVNFAEELKRVMIHGVLHLIGFNDKTDDEAAAMRKEEDFCLNLY